MTEERLPSRFSFILHADIAGSTALVQQDEALAHRRIQDSFRRFGDIIAKYHGHVRELRGDALLSEFERASDAVTAALAFQADQSEFLAQLDDPIQPKVRAGIAMGEVIIADDTITGEGVVLAQRVEQLADPGGVCVTGAIQEALPTRLPFDQGDMGEQQVKGFTKPVRVYSVGLKEGATLPDPAIASEMKRTSAVRWVIVAAVVVLICGWGLLAWLQPWKPDFEPASVEEMPFPLPVNPSIAVLPFENYSDDPKMEFFASGLTEDLTMAFSRSPWLFVIARNSAATYKGKPVNVKQVAEDLGIQYVLEGSVQKAGDNLRITTQLVDALSGKHLWAGRFDRPASDIFAVQDEITKHVLTELQVELTMGDSARVVSRGTENLDAWLLQLEGYSEMNKWTKDSLIRARELYASAYEADSNWAWPLAGTATTHWFDAKQGWSDSREESIRLGFESAERAIEIDPHGVFGLNALANMYFLTNQPEQGTEFARKAIKLAPNDFNMVAGMAMRIKDYGREQEAIELFERAMRLSPKHPWWVPFGYGLALHLVRRKEEAVETYKQAIGLGAQNARTYARLAAVYVDMGRMDDAKAAIKEGLRLEPNYTTQHYEKAYPMHDSKRDAWYKDLLVQAGLPEKPPLKLPDKPSIAVLPFQNLSGDEKQKYFVDGVTEDIITILSRFSELFVIAKRSSFRYREKDTEIGQIGKELGVQYVLEGSIRRSEDDLIVTVQLIDTASGTNIWTERYEEPLTDFFKVQEDILDNIVSTVAGRIENMELRLADQKETENLSAYDLVLRGYAQFPKWTRESFESARGYFHDAIELDPQYARAYAGIGFTHNIDFSRGWGEDPQVSLEKAREMSLKAIELDDKDNRPRVVLGWAYINAGELDKGIAEIKKGISLNPNDANVLARSGYALTYYGEFEQAIDQVKRAMRINPFYPSYYYDVLAWAQYFLKQYDEALKTLGNVPEPNIAHLLTLAAANARIGDSDKAQAYAKAILKKNPDFNLDKYRETRPFKHPEHIDFHVESLRMAGLP